MSQPSPLRVAIETSNHDERRRLALGSPEGTKFISFNNGASFWEYNSPERLAEIIAFINADEVEPPFSLSRMVEATLEAERKMFRA